MILEGRGMTEVESIMHSYSRITTYLNSDVKVH
jgi:hypothetical protein